MGFWGSWAIGETEEGPIVCLIDDDAKPHVSVYADKAINEAREQRDQRLMCEEIVEFLNGGKRPAWVADLDRFGEFGLFSPCGSYVIATGPYVSSDSDEFEWDESEEAVANRKELIGHIFK